jgi:hypothetical protein
MFIFSQIENAVGAAKDMDIDVNVQLDSIKFDLGDTVGKEAQEGVQAILESVRGVMTSEQLTQAVDDFNISLPTLHGDAVFASLAGSLQAAAELSGPVMANVGGAVLVLGQHLPYIAVAAGAIGVYL